MKVRDSWLGIGSGADVPLRGAAARALPCLNKNKCIEGPIPRDLNDSLNRLSTSHRKTAFALAQNVEYLCKKYGIERIGFLTLTFPDHVTDAKEAGRRFASLRTNVLSERYEETICVLERTKKGRIHFHLLVVMRDDIRTGFSFSEAAVGVYRSANQVLRDEWAFWRSITNFDGKHPEHSYSLFGRTELLPVKSTKDGISKYVGKYIEKHIGQREGRDKGVRLVRYSDGAKCCQTRFMFWSPRSRLLLWQYSAFAAQNGCADLDALTAKFGPHWRYNHATEIMNIEPPPKVILVIPATEDKEEEWITLWDIWHSDRIARSTLIAEKLGCTQAEVYLTLYSPMSRELATDCGPAVVERSCTVGGKVVATWQGARFHKTLEFEVPRWRPSKLKGPDFSDECNTTFTWSDGSSERTRWEVEIDCPF